MFILKEMFRIKYPTVLDVTVCDDVRAADWFMSFAPPTGRTRTVSPVSADKRKIAARYWAPVWGRFSSGSVYRDDTWGSADPPTAAKQDRNNNNINKQHLELMFKQHYLLLFAHLKEVTLGASGKGAGVEVPAFIISLLSDHLKDGRAAVSGAATDCG